MGDAPRLSIMLDDPIGVRTIEVTVEYDPEVLESVGGGSGQGFLDTGCPLFDGFDDGTPGVWQAYCVVLGAECWLTGPAELITWDFSALAPSTVKCMLKHRLALLSSAALLICQRSPYSPPPCSRIGSHPCSPDRWPPMFAEREPPRGPRLVTLI